MSDLMRILLLATLFGCGGYAIYVAIKLKKTGYLFPNKFIYPGNCEPGACLDEVGFMTFMLPRLWILAVACIVLGIIFGLTAFGGLALEPWITNFVIPGIGVLIFVWFIIVQNEAAKRFW